MSRGATARLFAAVELPTAVCEELIEWARRALGASGLPLAKRPPRAARVLAASSLHLTLCFLGSRPVAEIESLASALGACGEHACKLSVGAPLWLPPRRPRALAVEIHDRAGELARLQAHLTGALSHAGGWEPERRRFRPHVTVARVREESARARRSSDRPLLPATPRLCFTPAAIVLYRSWLSNAGATYESISTCALQPAGR